MGITMGFVAVTPEQLATVLAEPDRWDEIEEKPVRLGDSDEELTCELDKAWDGLTFLLWEAKIPLHLEIYMHDDVIGEDAAACGWPADEVRDAADQLRTTPFERLAEHFDPQAMTRAGIYPSVIWERDGDEALDYLRKCYEDLVRFFNAAAQSGAAALQSMSY